MNSDLTSTLLTGSTLTDDLFAEAWAECGTFGNAKRFAERLRPVVPQSLKRMSSIRCSLASTPWERAAFGLTRVVFYLSTDSEFLEDYGELVCLCCTSRNLNLSAFTIRTILDEIPLLLTRSIPYLKEVCLSSYSGVKIGHDSAMTLRGVAGLALFSAVPVLLEAPEFAVAREEAVLGVTGWCDAWRDLPMKEQALSRYFTVLDLQN